MSPNRLIRTGAVALAAILILSMATSCSSFNRDWKTTLADPTLTNNAWDGTWQSDMNGHHGRLRCLLTDTDTETERIARFRARYAKILVFEYSLPITTSGPATNTTFKVSADLGKSAGGFFQANGTITPTTFTAAYTSKWDWGTFTLAPPR